MSWALFLKLLHVLSAILFIGGMLGRGLAFAAAGRAAAGRAAAGRAAAGRAAAGRETEVTVAYALLNLSERFEKLMVRPGSEIVFVFGLLTAWTEKQPLFGVFQGAGPNWLFTALVLYLLTIPMALLILLPRSRSRQQAAEAALAAGKVTPELRAALGDRTVLVTRNVEMAIILVVVGLMVLKPF